MNRTDSVIQKKPVVVRAALANNRRHPLEYIALGSLGRRKDDAAYTAHCR